MYVQCEGVCCGGQWSNATLHCVSQYNDEVFPDEWCDSISKPNTRRSCSTSDCAQWNEGEWSMCPCGGFGLRSRTVTCVRGVNSEDVEVCSKCFGPVSSVQACTGGPCGEQRCYYGVVISSLFV